MKDSTVCARVELNVKSEAEYILHKLGVPVSVVINALYRQIIYQHGIPFSLSIPNIPKTLDCINDNDLNKKLQHSYEQSLFNEGRPFAQVFDELESGLI